MRNIAIWIVFVLFSALHGEEVLLNLPKRFDVKVSERWVTENGVRMTNDIILKEFDRPLTFHFDGESFTYTDKKHKYYGIDSTFVSSSGGGSFKRGVLAGTERYNTISYYNNELYHKNSGQAILNGQVDSNGKLHIISSHYTMDTCQIRLWKTGADKKGYLSTNFEICPYDWKSNADQFQGHYILQLPVGELQSSQKFIIDTLEISQEPSQAVIIPKVNLTASVSALTQINTEEMSRKTTSDPCKDPNQDDAMKEYCANKAYNQKLKEKEEMQSKAQEEEEQKQTEQKKILDTWYEEDRQANIKYNKTLEEQKKVSQDIEKKENEAFHETIAKEQSELKTKQANIKQAHDIVNNFGDDYETQQLTHRKIEQLSKDADISKIKEIKSAVKKQYYDASQIKLEGNAGYQTAKAEEIGKKGTYVEGIKDTSLTINKGLSKLDPTGMGEKIVSFQEDAYSGIEGYAKEGFIGAVDNLVEKKASDVSNGWSDTAKEEIETYKKYQKEGIELGEDEHYYDKEGNRLTQVKKYQKVYDKDHNEVSFSYGKRVFKSTINKLNDDYNTINTAATKVEEIKEGVMTGDYNKALNAGLDAMDAKDSINESTDKIVTRVGGKKAGDGD